MGYIVYAIVGLIMLAVVAWLSHRLRVWQHSEQRDRLRSDERALNEAELLTRSKGPFI